MPIKKKKTGGYEVKYGGVKKRAKTKAAAKRIQKKYKGKK